MSKKEDTERDPLTGTQAMSAVATGGGGGIFQARVGALYLANMLTGLLNETGVGCNARPQPGRRCTTLRRNSIGGRVNPEDLSASSPGERSKDLPTPLEATAQAPNPGASGRFRPSKARLGRSPGPLNFLCPVLENARFDRGFLVEVMASS